MPEYNIILPSKPRVVLEKDFKGVYEVDGLYPGYGHTLGNSLRRIILSSLPGAAITMLKIDGVTHEFSTIDGIKEDVITILLNLKKIRFKMATDEATTASISIKGAKVVTGADIKCSGQLEVLNPTQVIAELTDKNAHLDIEMTVEKGLGFVQKTELQKGKMDIGMIAVDSTFSPVRRVAYEVENMRVGDKTNYNRLRISLETDGTIMPREALERSIEIMITQLKAILDFKFDVEIPATEKESAEEVSGAETKEESTDAMKTRLDTLNISTRTLNALTGAGIRTVGGIARKKKEDLLEIDGMGEKGIQEIKRVLGEFGLNLK